MLSCSGTPLKASSSTTSVLLLRPEIGRKGERRDEIESEALPLTYFVVGEVEEPKLSKVCEGSFRDLRRLVPFEINHLNSREEREDIG